MKNLVAQFQQILAEKADGKVKSWFEAYLKNIIEYRGVKTPQITILLKSWMDQNPEIKKLNVEEKLQLAISLLSQTFAEDKLASAVLISKYLITKIDHQKIISAVSNAFEKGYIWDWSTNDWFCVRVFGPIVLKNQADAKLIALWRKSDNLWQRRSSIVAFRSTAKTDRDYPLIENIVADLVVEEERFIQTGIGWLISDISKHDPAFASRLIDTHFEHLSTEVIDRHTKFLPRHIEYKQAKRRSRQK